jgi:hypothetical protein
MGRAPSLNERSFRTALTVCVRMSDVYDNNVLQGVYKTHSSRLRRARELSARVLQRCLCELLE